MKTCTLCNTAKDLTAFVKSNRNKSGLASRCKDCIRGLSRNYRKDKPVECAASARNSMLKREYGLTSTEYERMLDQQGGGCRVCGQTDHDRRLAVDHDHRTGAIRGLLCKRCNLVLGKVDDDTTLLKALSDYLNE
jgi:hypothetical protein